MVFSHVRSLHMGASLEYTRVVIFGGQNVTSAHRATSGVEAYKRFPQRETQMQASEISYRHAVDNFGPQKPPVFISAISTSGALWTRKRQKHGGKVHHAAATCKGGPSVQSGIIYYPEKKIMAHSSAHAFDLWRPSQTTFTAIVMADTAVTSREHGGKWSRTCRATFGKSARRPGGRPASRP